MEQFGAFVDIGCGIIGLLPIERISVSRIEHPKDRFSPGQKILVAVLQIDTKLRRITLTHRELLGTWDENAAEFTPGQTVTGTIRSVEDYGIFVELTPNLAGLAEFKENVYPDQTAAVYIKSIIPDKMKIKLIIIDTTDEPIYRKPLEYFIDPEKTERIDKWTYSPPGSRKLIESSFV